MEIRAAGPGQDPVSVTVTMRTPGSDFELAAGFLHTEGLVRSREDIHSIRYCELPPEQQNYNVVTVRLSCPFQMDGEARHFYATSSCGICGKASLEAIQLQCRRLPRGPEGALTSTVISSLPERLRKSQRIFDETGGLHAGGLFDMDGTTRAIREDVGRHNAVDKLVGWALLAGKVPLHQQVLTVSGRISFEIVQKAAVAGIPVICAVSAPSSLAVEAAQEFGMTIVGFVRGESFNVYTCPERVGFDGS